jgi:hypothetical protein
MLFSTCAVQHKVDFDPGQSDAILQSESILTFPNEKAQKSKPKTQVIDVHHCNRLNASYDRIFGLATDEYRGDLALPPHLQSLCRLALKERAEREKIIPQGVLGIGKSAVSTARRVVYVIASFSDSFMWVASTRGTAAQDFVELCLRANLYPKRDPFKWILQQGADNLIAIPIESLNANAGEVYAPSQNHDTCTISDESLVTKHDISGEHCMPERKGNEDDSLTAPPKVFIPPAARFGPLSKAREQYWRGLLAGAAMPDLDFSY